MHHLRAEKAGAHLAEGAHQLPLVGGALELPQLAAVEIQEAQHQAFGVHHELALRPVFHFDLQHARLDLHGLPGRRRVRSGVRRVSSS